MSNFFISDIYFGVGYRNHMNDTHVADKRDAMIIKKWNYTVSNNDDVWILGNLCGSSKLDPSAYLKKMNGRKHLIIGEHDTKILQNKSVQRYLASIHQMYCLRDGEHNIVLCSYPMTSWYEKRKGTWLIHGHIGSRVSKETEFLWEQGRILNANIKINNFVPVPFEILKENNIRFQENKGLMQGEMEAYFL